MLDVLFAVLLYRALPEVEPSERIAYSRLILSVGQAVLSERAVRWTLVLGATAFGTFTMLWTALTFLLSAPPFGYPVTVIGLFGLAGLAGAIAAQRAGRLHDMGKNLPATGLAWVLALGSFVLTLFMAHSAVVLVLVLILFDIAVQSINILNQSRLFSVSDTARSRLNTAFVTCNFIGGAIGSALAGVLWTAGGWRYVALAGIAMTCFGFIVWAVGRRAALLVFSAD